MLDMLEVARKLAPDIETNMPEAVRKAFDEGKVTSIFRTTSDPMRTPSKQFLCKA